MVRQVLAALAAAAALSGIASAQELKTKVSAAEIEAILSGAGLSVQMIEDAQTRAPVAHVEAGGVQYWVRALDCSGAPMACSTLVFFANFELGRAVADSDYRTVNKFNDGQVFGRAYLIPARNQVGVDYTIELDGGVSMDNVTANVARWADVITAFIGHFSKGEPTS